MRHHPFEDLRTHVLLAVFVGWWTLSIANLVYAASSYVSSGEYLLLDGEEESEREGWGLCRRCVRPVDGSASACEACGYDPAATLRKPAWQSLLLGFLLLVFVPIIAVVLLASGAIAVVLYLAGPSPAD